MYPQHLGTLRYITAQMKILWPFLFTMTPLLYVIDQVRK